MTLELLKVIVQPIALERDDDGRIVGEKVGEPTAIYELDKVQAFVDELRAELELASIAARSPLVLP